MARRYGRPPGAPLGELHLGDRESPVGTTQPGCHSVALSWRGAVMDLTNTATKRPRSLAARSDHRECARPVLSVLSTAVRSIPGSRKVANPTPGESGSRPSSA